MLLTFVYLEVQHMGLSQLRTRAWQTHAWVKAAARCAIVLTFICAHSHQPVPIRQTLADDRIRILLAQIHDAVRCGKCQCAVPRTV